MNRVKDNIHFLWCSHTLSFLLVRFHTPKQQAELICGRICPIMSFSLDKSMGEELIYYSLKQQTIPLRPAAAAAETEDGKYKHTHRGGYFT